MKTFKILILFLSFGSLGLYQNCNVLNLDRGIEFFIINQTNQTINWYIPPIQEQLSILDLPNSRPTLVNKLAPNEEFFEYLRSTEQNYFDELPEDTLHIFILSTNTYENKDWQTIVNDNDILQRIKLTEDSLKALERKVVVQ